MASAASIQGVKDNGLEWRCQVYFPTVKSVKFDPNEDGCLDKLEPLLAAIEAWHTASKVAYGHSGHKLPESDLPFFTLKTMVSAHVEGRNVFEDPEELMVIANNKLTFFYDYADYQRILLSEEAHLINPTRMMAFMFYPEAG
jgi:hypothetical protein